MFKGLILFAVLTVVQVASVQTFGMGGGGSVCTPGDEIKMRDDIVKAMKEVNAKLKKCDKKTEIAQVNGKNLEIYDSVSNRSLEELRNDPQYTGCTTSARLIGDKLSETYGLKIVATVQNEELDKMCSHKGKDWADNADTTWKENLQKRQISASGHQVILIHRPCSSSWYYFNPRDKEENVKLTPAKFSPQILTFEMQKKQIMLPYEVVKEQAARIVKEQKIEDPFKGGLTIVGVWEPEFTHSYKSWLNIIASGARDNPKCRYDSSKTMMETYPDGGPLRHISR